MSLTENKKKLITYLAKRFKSHPYEGIPLVEVREALEVSAEDFGHIVDSFGPDPPFFDFFFGDTHIRPRIECVEEAEKIEGDRAAAAISPSFWQRNKDQILLLIFTNVLAAVLGLIVGLLLAQ